MSRIVNYKYVRNDINDICSTFAAESVEYFLDSGSLLGAVRSGSMIPNDGDVDFGLLNSTEGGLFDALITQKRPKINDYLTGKSNDIEAALDELAMEFASFEYRGGTTYYNDGVNKASIKRTRAAAALRSAREEMMAGGRN